MTRLYGFQVGSGALDVEATFNDWPIHRRSRTQDPGGGDAFVSWLMCEGEANEAEVRVRGRLEDELQMMVLVWCGVIDTDDRRDFARYRWHHQLEPTFPRDIEERWVSLVRHRFAVRRAYGRWAWEQAERNDPARHRAAILDHLEELAEALRRKDLTHVMAMLETKNEHLARTKGVDPARYAEGNRRVIARFMAEPDYRVEVRTPTVMEGRNRGRLVWMEDDERSPPITIYGGEGAIQLDTIPSIIDGKPRIVR
jgi:hypothetical protein